MPTHSFNEYFLSAYYVFGTILDSGTQQWSKQIKSLPLWNLERDINKCIITNYGSFPEGKVCKTKKNQVPPSSNLGVRNYSSEEVMFECI